MGVSTAGITNLSGLAIGGGIPGGSAVSAGSGLIWSHASAISLAAITYTATKSTETTASWPGAKVNDVVTLGLPSALSAGLTFDAYVDTANSVTIRGSNVSSANAAQTAQTLVVEVRRYN